MTGDECSRVVSYLVFGACIMCGCTIVLVTFSNPNEDVGRLQEIIENQEALAQEIQVVKQQVIRLDDDLKFFELYYIVGGLQEKGAQPGVF